MIYIVIKEIKYKINWTFVFIRLRILKHFIYLILWSTFQLYFVFVFPFTLWLIHSSWNLRARFIARFDAENFDIKEILCHKIHEYVLKYFDDNNCLPNMSKMHHLTLQFQIRTIITDESKFAFQICAFISGAKTFLGWDTKIGLEILQLNPFIFNKRINQSALQKIDLY